MDLRKFATEKVPLHASGVGALLACPWRVVMEMYAEGEGDSGAAADTGSAMHRAAAEFHRGKEVAACLEVMRGYNHLYPKADLVDAATMFLTYARDPRNRVPTVLVEQQIDFGIKAHASDPTQEDISVTGTVDQVREENSRCAVWDIKTSKRDPLEILHESMFQAACYCIGASILLGREVHPGGIIMPRRYRSDATGPTHWPFVWKLSDIPAILEPVRLVVAAVRRGEVWHTPNANCKWCIAKSPDFCFPKLKELKQCVISRTS